MYVVMFDLGNVIFVYIYIYIYIYINAIFLKELTSFPCNHSLHPESVILSIQGIVEENINEK